MGVTETGCKECREYILNLAKQVENTTPLLKSIGTQMVVSIQKRIEAGIAPENSEATQAYKKNNKTLRDTNTYYASFTYEITGKNSVKVGTPSKLAPVLNDGATIRPKKAKMLYIPAGAKTRSFERSANAAESATSSVRAVINYLENGGYQVWWSKGAVMAKKGKKGKEFPVYYLKKVVTIPARKHIYISDEDLVNIQGIIDNHLAKIK